MKTNFRREVERETVANHNPYNTAADPVAATPGSEEALRHNIEVEARRLYTDRLSHREVIDQLESMGYSRSLVTEIIRRMATQRRITGDVTAPVIFFVVTFVIFLWSYCTPTPEKAPMQFQTFKGLVGAVSGLAVIPLFAAAVYKTYDLIPIFTQRSIEHNLRGNRAQNGGPLNYIETEYRNGNLTETACETLFVEALGKTKGRQYFLNVRNRKHFGID